MESILTLKGYFMRHFTLCLTSSSQQEAWEKLEDELRELQEGHGFPHQPRYTSYESFRVRKTKYYQNNRD